MTCNNIVTQGMEGHIRNRNPSARSLFRSPQTIKTIIINTCIPGYVSGLRERLNYLENGMDSSPGHSCEHGEVSKYLERELREHMPRCRMHPARAPSGNIRVCWWCCPVCKINQEARVSAEKGESDSYRDKGAENAWILMA